MKQELKKLVAECYAQGILVSPEMIENTDLIYEALARKKKNKYTVKIVKNYTKQPNKRTVQHFVKYFTKRYQILSSILRLRKELADATTISRVKFKKDRDTACFIGMVLDIRETSSGHIVLTLEDPTDQIEVWLHNNNRELMQHAKEIVFDEVIGVTGQVSGKRVFANSIVFPDVPLTKEMKKNRRETYAVFVGDVELGSKLFMREEFDNVILWLSGKVGTDEQMEAAKKVGYVVFIGDLVHGIGVYPGQIDDSDIHDIKEQYRQFARYVKMIPSHIQVIIITGNHDSGRLQEPQLPIYKDFAEELYEMKNVHLLSNPCYVTIEEEDENGGLDLLLYHGYSIIYYAQNVQPIKDAGGLKAVDKVMKLYLKKRHLAPTHGCNTYVPDPEEDPMVIDKVPDFLITGHTHNIAHGTYNGVTMINPGCWIGTSDEQVKRGLEPDPGILPIVNLKTREVSMINFGQ